MNLLCPHTAKRLPNAGVRGLEGRADGPGPSQQQTGWLGDLQAACVWEAGVGPGHEGGTSLPSHHKTQTCCRVETPLGGPPPLLPGRCPGRPIPGVPALLRQGVGLSYFRGSCIPCTHPTLPIDQTNTTLHTLASFKPKQMLRRE